MNYYLVSDTHFNHLKLEEWGGRTGDWQDSLWKGIEAIPDGDILIHLGDIAIGHDEEVCKRITQNKNVRHILIRGNHDNRSASWYMERGFDFVCDGLELLFHGHYLHLTHRPARPQNNTSWNIHGHTHGNMHRSEEYLDYYSKAYHIDISPEIVGFKPILLKTLLKKVNHNGN
jgi:calcineurin-like phosphoesterase family protein